METVRRVIIIELKHSLLLVWGSMFLNLDLDLDTTMLLIILTSLLASSFLIDLGDRATTGLGFKL